MNELNIWVPFVAFLVGAGAVWFWLKLTESKEQDLREKELLRVKDKVADLETKNSQLRADAKKVKKLSERIAELEANQGQKAVFETEISQLKKQIAILEETKQTLSKRDEQVRVATTEKQQLQEQLKQQSIRIEELTRKENQVKRSEDQMREAQRVMSQAQRLAEESKGLELRVKSKDEQLQKLNKQLLEVTAQKDALSNQLASYGEGPETVLKLGHDKDGAIKEAARLRVRITELTRENTKLKEQRPHLDLGEAAKAFGRKVSPQDLTVVEGIGPKIAEVLSKAGLHSWGDVASCPAYIIIEILERASVPTRLLQPELWGPRAALLMQGKWEAAKAVPAPSRTTEVASAQS